ncbi:hypothetical protein DFP72DRAFT_595307 [Ephemerocybe angulata]|uniref:Uncharacterized protein n=1 Tax=Ephemerocybe angulata TaxID=980116 RepID=A0A8H6ID70_9AGAR|nr:hypothetical protein DFP72DRAFT_595307 [Tulosesus angulatus]
MVNDSTRISSPSSSPNELPLQKVRKLYLSGLDTYESISKLDSFPYDVSSVLGFLMDIGSSSSSHNAERIILGQMRKLKVLCLQSAAPITIEDASFIKSPLKHLNPGSFSTLTHFTWCHSFDISVHSPLPIVDPYGGLFVDNTLWKLSSLEDLAIQVSFYIGDDSDVTPVILPDVSETYGWGQLEAVASSRRCFPRLHSVVLTIGVEFGHRAGPKAKNLSGHVTRDLFQNHFRELKNLHEQGELEVLFRTQERDVVYGEEEPEEDPLWRING